MTSTKNKTTLWLLRKLLTIVSHFESERPLSQDQKERMLSFPQDSTPRQILQISSSKTILKKKEKKKKYAGSFFKSMPLLS